jgi:hypothetical protein
MSDLYVQGPFNARQSWIIRHFATLGGIREHRQSLM